MMYDIEILVPVKLDGGKYSARLDGFKRLGLQNVGDKRVLLRIAVGTDPVPADLLQGWPQGIDVEVISGKCDQVAAKVTEYYVGLPRDYANRARWFVRVDDDSLTDISGLVSGLDDEYDFHSQIYTGTCLRAEIHWVDLGILRDMKADFKLILHEVEANAISTAAMDKILNCELAQEYLRRRVLIQDGFCDQPLAIAGRFAKIHASQSSLMSLYPHFPKLKLFGGHLAHIHFVAPDLQPHFDFLKQKFIEQLPFTAPVLGRTYLVCCGGGWDVRGLVTFLDTGFLDSSSGEFRAWMPIGDKIQIFNDEGTTRVLLSPKEKNYEVLTGFAWHNENFFFREVAR